MNDTISDQKKKIHDYLTGLGVQYQATFQPTPQPKETIKSPQLHWLITLTRGKSVMQCPYSEGMGHVKGYKQFHKTKYDQRQAEELYRKTCETGKLYLPSASGDYVWARTLGEKVQPAPDVADVLYCLVSDSDVLNYPTYEQWAGELGYEADSRKGEATYRLCIEQSLKLRNLLGYKAMEELAALYQDY